MRSRDDSRDYGTTGHADGPLQLLPTEESQNTVKKLFVKKLSVKVMNAGGRAACHQIETRLGLPCPPGQVRFNRVPEKAPQKVPEKVPGGFGAEPDQVQQGSGEGSWEALAQSQVRLNRICGHLTHGNPAEVFPALGFAARFRKKEL